MDQTVQVKPWRVDVVIPTYKRTHMIPRLIAEMANTPGADPLFVVHASDEETLQALLDADCRYVIDYAPPSGVNAANRGYQAVTSFWFVLTQDDIQHHEGWLENARITARDSGATVVGFNDGGTNWSVAWLMKRDQELSHGTPGVIFNPGYGKNYADNELNEYAKARGIWAYSDKSLAEHLHPGFGKSPGDDTHAMGEEHIQADIALYAARKQLWS